MKGDNIMLMGQNAMREALQVYFDKILMPSAYVDVGHISQESTGRFRVVLEERKPVKAAK